ncbi:type II toxin-antitoxin system HicB family antitoxin [Ancylobacter oerskovii]|uniref:Type II toxin-antitoxin system HicB family antitoxin n=1 Tax=Ancylobacter oerskovii TaxID=459519 RepID=A0ABW4Z542_9HYPH|nr:type II toxin-antitoxin system HicB family antitoxin [Ancylobacter oerskovii]MBS7543083.1 type II toxin-antitoxin system HicB family antitoxin [Ancylobacter oerskovii]
MFYFPLVLTPDDNDTFLVTCPTLPEVTTFGETREDALRYGAEAVEEAVAARVAGWEDVPVPEDSEANRAALAAGDFARLPLQATMKLLLFFACQKDSVTRAELARRMGVHREQVDRLFRFDHASRLDQIDAAFQALNQSVNITLEAA